MPEPRFIDSHVHFLPEHFDAFVGSLAEMGLTGLWNIAYTGNDHEPYGPSAENEVAELLEQSHRLAPGTVHTFFWPAWQQCSETAFPKRCVEQVARLHKLGIAGIKVWKDLGLGIKDPQGKLAMLDDERLNPIWEKLVELKLMLIAHVADPAPFWLPMDENNPALASLKRNPEWHFGKPGLPTREKLFDARNNFIRRFPDLVVLNCHCGGYAESMAQLGGWMDEMPNFYASLNPNHVKPGDPGLKAFLARHGGRILFETDLGIHRGRAVDIPWNKEFWGASLAKARELFKPFGKDALEKYAHLNAENMMRNTTR